jgi:segregation and condensation protein B
VSDSDLSRLEAILFLAREPLTSRKLSQYANLADGTQARTLVRRLNEQYDAAGRAFRVEQVAGGYQLLTRPKLAPWLRRLAHVPGETRLSAPALETLAVIAYRQPAGRADIEAIRGVNCGEILRQLMDRDLVRISGRSAELGRPYLYATTKRFLELFGLNHIEDLPRGHELRTSPLPAAPPVIPLVASEPEPPSERDDEPPSEFSDQPIDEIESESTFG